MGLSTALGYAEAAADGGIPVEVAISAHMQTNLYPAPPSFMLPVAVAAVEAANDGDWERMIDLPDGVEDITHGTHTPASTVIDNFRLEAFVQ